MRPWWAFWRPREPTAVEVAEAMYARILVRVRQDFDALALVRQQTWEKIRDRG